MSEIPQFELGIVECGNGERRRRIEDLAAEIAAGDDDVREYAEQAYGSWAGGDDISKEMRKLGQALGLTSDPA